MGSRTTLVSMNTRSAPFSYTDPGSGKSTLKDSQNDSSGTEDKKKYPSQGNANRSKMGILGGLFSKNNKNKSPPPAPRKPNNNHPPCKPITRGKANIPTGKAPSAKGTSKTGTEQELITTRPAFSREDTNLYGCFHTEDPNDVLPSSHYGYQSSDSLYEEPQQHALNAPARAERSSYDGIATPTTSALRATTSLPSRCSLDFTTSKNVLPARPASFGPKTQPTRLENPQGDKMGELKADYWFAKQMNIPENTEHDNTDELYENVIVADQTSSMRITSSDSSYDDLCTDSCDVGKLSLKTSSDYLNVPPVKPRPEKETRRVSMESNVTQQDYESVVQDARYISDRTISSGSISSGTISPFKPKSAPRSSLKSQVPQQQVSKTQPSQDGNKIPPKPAKKPSKPRHKELPEIQLLLDDARGRIKSKSTEVIVFGVDFTARFLGKEGGRLRLQYHGVILDVPPEALEDLVFVYIYVQRSLAFSPIADEGFVSPLVHCGVSGLKFKTPVFLTFPVRLEDSSEWKLKGIQQDSYGQPWKDIPSKSCQDSQVTVQDGLCTMIVDHFTLFGLSAQPKTLRGASCGSGGSPGVLPLRVGVFLPRDKLTLSGHLQLRVRIWDESKETHERVERAELERGSKVIDTTCLLLRTSEVTGNEGLDVSVVIRVLNVDSWKSDPNDKIISYENFLIHPHGRVDVSATFNLKKQGQNSEGGLHPLQCDFVIGQGAHFKLAQTIRAVLDIHDSGMHIEPADKFPNPMSTSGFRRLCDYLDEEKRWALLADLCFGSTRGCTFDRWPCPSTAVLNLIFSRSAVHEPQAALRDLCSKLRECHLSGAAEIVRKEMTERNREEVRSDSTQAWGKQLGKSTKPKTPVQCTEEDSLASRGAAPPNYNEHDTVYEVLMPRQKQRSNAQSRPATANSYRASRREPEENDEEQGQIHTLQSTHLPAQTHPSFASRKPVPAQRRLYKLAQTHGDVVYFDAFEERPAPDADGRHETPSTTRNFQISPSNSTLNSDRNTNANGDDLPYADCLLKDQSGPIGKPKSSTYMNFVVLREKETSSLSKGYCKLEK